MNLLLSLSVKSVGFQTGFFLKPGVFKIKIADQSRARVLSHMSYGLWSLHGIMMYTESVLRPPASEPCFNDGALFNDVLIL